MTIRNDSELLSTYKIEEKYFLSVPVSGGLGTYRSQNQKSQVLDSALKFIKISKSEMLAWAIFLLSRTHRTGPNWTLFHYMAKKKKKEREKHVNDMPLHTSP